MLAFNVMLAVTPASCLPAGISVFLGGGGVLRCSLGIHKKLSDFVCLINMSKIGIVSVAFAVSPVKTTNLHQNVCCMHGNDTR